MLSPVCEICLETSSRPQRAVCPFSCAIDDVINPRQVTLVETTVFLRLEDSWWEIFTHLF